MAITNGYCTLAEVKAALKIDSGDTSVDALLERSVEVASRRIDGDTSRRFYADAAATARIYAAERNEVLFVDDISSTTGLVIKTDNNADGTYETTLAVGVDLQLEPLNSLAQGEPVFILRAFGGLFPVSAYKRALVEVTAKWGWPSVPHAIREASCLLAERQFRRLDSPLGVVGFGDLGAISVRRTDPDIADTIEPFKRHGIA